MQEIIKFLNLECLEIHYEQVSTDEYDLKINKKDNNVLIEYVRKHHLLRALGILKLREKEQSFELIQKSSFENLSYLIDVARDAVPTLTTLKSMILKLALLGYSRVYINFEDLITLDNEPYFGYLRGRYTKDEMKHFNAYCDSIGIELVPCIQTLAHMNGMMIWPEYQDMRDVNDIMLAGSEKTYNFIEKQFRFIKECFSSNLVHIGMDEAHMVGRGKYLDDNGYHQPSEVMLNHLNKVAELANKYDLKPQMWSDMFFRLAFGGYYTKTGTLSEDVLKLVPDGVEQVYWDYVTDDNEMLDNMFRNHKLFKGGVSFAAGGWKWNGWNPSNKFSIYLAKIQLKACKKNGIQNVILTAWSDDGAEASIYSILPTAIYYAEYTYNSGLNTAHLENISNTLFGVGYKAMLDSDLTLVEPGEEIENYNYLNYSNLAKIIMYNDVLSGPYTGVIERFKFKNIETYKLKMRRYSKKYPSFQVYFKLLENLCACLEIKAHLSTRIRAAYKEKNVDVLKVIADKDIPLLIKRINSLLNVFYTQWMSENKTNSFEVHSIRLGGLKERLIVVQKLLKQFVSGERKHIEELEVEVVTMKDIDALGHILWCVYRKMNSVNVF